MQPRAGAQPFNHRGTALADLYLWLLALHIMAFAAWMAAMWYLPRLFIYHRDSPVGGEASATFMVMERRLLKAIGTPAMIVTIVLGLVLTTMLGQWTQGWLHAKLLLVLGIAVCHGMMARYVKRFAADERPHSTRWFRVFNEVPTVLFIGIVVLAVFKPF